jgi:hypothetical protein
MRNLILAGTAIGLLSHTRAMAETIKAGGAEIQVTIREGPLDLPKTVLMDWITKAAQAVSVYYGRFPVPSARIDVRPRAGRQGITNGTTYGGQGAFTRISVGEHTTKQDLDDDWMMTHELVHMTFPDMAEEHHWIEEGIATYVEPIAREQAGQLSPTKIWRDMVNGMPQGLPESGDRGLDHTHTWGRTYWGGALFCLIADVEIRKATKSQKGLQDALRAILNAGGNITVDWTIEKAFETGDRATGAHVLTNLYEQMKAAAVETNLPALWKELGVEVHGDALSFDDRAPLAAVRSAINGNTKMRERIGMSKQ